MQVFIQTVFLYEKLFGGRGCKAQVSCYLFLAKLFFLFCETFYLEKLYLVQIHFLCSQMAMSMAQCQFIDGINITAPFHLCSKRKFGFLFAFAFLWTWLRPYVKSIAKVKHSKFLWLNRDLNKHYVCYIWNVHCSLLPSSNTTYDWVKIYFLKDLCSFFFIPFLTYANMTLCQWMWHYFTKF